MSTRNLGRNASGGTRPRQRIDIDHSASVGPVAAHVGLCRAFLAKQRLLTSDEVEMAESFLTRAVRQPLSPRQWAWLQEHARRVGAVYEEPDEAPLPAGAVSVQPWGALPAKPPGRL